MLLRNLSPKRTRGFTLLETMSAIGMVGAFIAILIVVSSSVLNLLRTSKDNVSASQVLQERAEQLRLTSWGQLTNASRLATDVLSSETASTSGLSTPIETVVISPYPAKSGFTPGKVVRKNGAATVVSSNAALENERIVRVDVTLTWSGFPKKRDRTRAATVLIAKGSSAN